MPPTVPPSGQATTTAPVRPHPHAPFHPTSDQATYRDLLLFEERLKMNAEMLRKRRRRYNAFLWIFIGMLIIMTYRLFVRPPQNHLLLRALQASCTVVFMTLALFFASGMYEEKIRYAHSYINHSNKALRPLNMHLNMRLPRFSVLAYLPWYSTPSSTPTVAVKVPPKMGVRRPSTNTIMATIPPSSNPRGELIFSSRVDKAFREGYERYRAAFERRREEKARAERDKSWKTLWGRLETAGIPRSTASPTPPTSRRGTPPPGATFAGSGGRSSRAPSPGVGIRVGSSLRSDNTTVPPTTDEKEKPNGGTGNRERADSYSFLLSGTKEPPLRPHT